MKIKLAILTLAVAALTAGGAAAHHSFSAMHDAAKPLVWRRHAWPLAGPDLNDQYTDQTKRSMKYH